MNRNTFLYRSLILVMFFVLSCNKDEIQTVSTTETEEEEGETSVFLGEIDYIKTFGGTKNDAAKSVIRTSDGGYAVIGYTQSSDFDITDKTNDSFDFWLLKFNDLDELQFSKTYGGSLDDRGSDIVQTQDGGYAILGFTESNDLDVTENSGFRDYWISKLDTNGNLLWQKSFGYAGSDNGVSLINTSDNGYLLIGVLDVSASNGEGNSRGNSQHAGGDIWAIKLNQSGDKLWSQYYGGSFNDSPNDVKELADGSYIIVGSSDSDDVDINNNIGSYDFWILKISSTGALVWEKNFGGAEIDEATGIAVSQDGSFTIVGDTRSSDNHVSVNNGGADLWIINISESGNLLWEKTIGGSGFDVARSIKISNQGYLISGFSRSSFSGLNNKGQTDAWVLEVDTSGNLLWQKNIGGTDLDFSFDAVQLDDGKIIAIGETVSSDIDINLNKGFSDVLVVKVK